MAFTFVVETGTADPDANSYTTVQYFRDYISLNSYVDITTLDDDDIERLLARSSKYLDNMVAWNGTRVDDESGLRWPRSGVYDQDGFEIPSDVIPFILQDSVCEFGGYLTSSDWTAPEDSRGLKQIEVDTINLRWADNYIRASLPDYLVAMLASLGEVNRGIRPAFKKISRS